jgi:peptide/nickel transport system ATP-binding protein
MAMRVVVMYAGKIAEEAPVRELFEDPKHPYTQGLLRSVPVIGRKSKIGRKLREIPGIVPSALQRPAGCYFHPRCVKKMPVCSEQSPPMLEIGSKRRVCCWLMADSIR